MSLDPTSSSQLSAHALPREPLHDRDALARRFILQLLAHRRPIDPHDPCVVTPCEACIAPHLEAVSGAIRRNEPVRLVLPAFPAKSPNPSKVLGTLPDLAEETALGFLQALGRKLSDSYPPGVRLTICSDGHVFSDLVLVGDADVSAYQREIEAMLARHYDNLIDVYTMEQEFGSRPFAEMRRALVEQFATPLEALRHDVARNAGARALFNGVHRFLFEDRIVLLPHRTRNAVRDESKRVAYAVIQRSHAWSRLIASRIPNAVRLSCHPQPCHSSKLGIQMLSAPDLWMTPWHAALLKTKNGDVLIRRSDAEAMRASLISRHGRPSHFVAQEGLE